MDAGSTINTIVADVLDLDADTVNGDLSPGDTESWDSMTHLTLVTAIEGELGIKFTMEEVQSVECLNDMYAIVKKHLEDQ